MTDQERIEELEKALGTILELYKKECAARHNAELMVIKYQKMLLGLLDDR